eukprot:4353025-Pyramimonas_sp.AAC.1
MQYTLNRTLKPSIMKELSNHMQTSRAPHVPGYTGGFRFMTHPQQTCALKDVDVVNRVLFPRQPFRAEEQGRLHNGLITFELQMPMHRTRSKVLDMPKECLASSIETAININMLLANRIRDVIP